MGEIAPLKKALREAGNIYAELTTRAGAICSKCYKYWCEGWLLNILNTHLQKKLNYSLKEFA